MAFPSGINLSSPTIPESISHDQTLPDNFASNRVSLVGRASGAEVEREAGVGVTLGEGRGIGVSEGAGAADDGVGEAVAGVGVGAGGLVKYESEPKRRLCRSVLPLLSAHTGNDTSIFARASSFFPCMRS